MLKYFNDENIFKNQVIFRLTVNFAVRTSVLQSNLFITDTKGTKSSVCIRELRNCLKFHSFGTMQASVIQKISIQWIVQLVSQILICWIVIYPVDSAIQCLNNLGQNYIHDRVVSIL